MEIQQKTKMGENSKYVLYVILKFPSLDERAGISKTALSFFTLLFYIPW